jgi:hypothetical protein
MLLLQVKELEVKLKEEGATKLTGDDQKKKLGLKDTIEITRLKKEVKMKTEELDKLKAQSRKVSDIKINYFQVLP